MEKIILYSWEVFLSNNKKSSKICKSKWVLSSRRPRWGNINYQNKFWFHYLDKLLGDFILANQILWNNDGVRWEISSSKICKSNWVLSCRRVRARESPSVCVVVVVIAFTRVPAHFRILCCIFCKRRNFILLKFQVDEFSNERCRVHLS